MTEPARDPTRLVLTGGLVIDGTGNPEQPLDLVLEGGRILEIGPPGTLGSTGEQLRVDGLAVAPGFIDLHTHCDFVLPTYPRADAMIRQGVTTIVVGNCGHSVFPVGSGERHEMVKNYSAFLGRGLDWTWHDAASYIEALQSLPLAINVALLVGHGTIRVATMGFDQRAPSATELATMEAEVDSAMRAGAFGLSSGLIYAPGTYAAAEELITLARVAAKHNGFYATHIRNEGPALLSAVSEAIAIADRAALPLQLSHHKVLGKKNWGLTSQSLELIDAARSRGLDVTSDQYPYPASATTLTALLPAWALEGGASNMQTRIRDSATRARLVDEILHGPTDGRPRRHFEPDTLMIASVPTDGPTELVGQTIAQLAAESGSPAVDVMLDLLHAHAAIEVVIFAIGEDDIHRVMKHPQIAVASDGWTLDPREGGTPHPRSYGTFARVLGHYVREEKVLSLPEAIRKMTSLPARRLGLSDLGVIRAGAIADLVVFDPSVVGDKATFADPHQFCVGVEHVFLGGDSVIRGGIDTGAAAGRVLRARRPHS